MEEDNSEKIALLPCGFSLKNFGPIKNADIDLNRLTVIIGPNNSGKSYAALAIKSLLRGVTYKYPNTFVPMQKAFMTYFQKQASSKRKIDWNTPVAEIVRRTSKAIFGIESDLSDEEVFEILNNTLLVVESLVLSGLEGSFGDSITNVIRHGTKSTKLVLNTVLAKIELTVNKSGLRLTGFSLAQELIDQIMDESLLGSLEGTRESASNMVENILRWYTIYRGLQVSQEEVEVAAQEARIQVAVLNLITPLIPMTWYIPASRSGAIQTYRTVTSALIQGIPFAIAGREQMQMPTLSDTMTELYVGLGSIPESPGELAGLVDDFEEDMIHGHIQAKEGPIGGSPIIEYMQGSETVGLQRASSSVSELAPIFLFLRYFVSKRSLLIIEEPEAHLHPENQLKLTSLIVRLVRSGVHMLITTHSEFMLNALSNHIKAGKLSETRRESIGIRKEDYLTAEEVSAYLFRFEKDGSSKSEDLKIDEDGIPDEEFLRVNEALNDQSVSIDFGAERLDEEEKQ